MEYRVTAPAHTPAAILGQPPTDDPNRRLEMKNKEEKAQETETRRPYEKPVLIIINTTASRGKANAYYREGVSYSGTYAPS
jgi:hypothetical protein